MQQVSDPPYVPIRPSGWPTRQSPRWLIGAGAVLLAISLAVGLSHHPTQGERATDLRGLLSTLTTDIESCSGGVGDSLNVLKAIDNGSSHDIATALNVADTGAANCSPANNSALDDLTAVQVPESLSSYHLQRAVTGLIDWAAPDAADVMTDVATVLTARGKPAAAADRAALAAALRKLATQRQVVYAALEPAIKALSPTSAPPVLWVTARPA